MLPHLVAWQKQHGYPMQFACEATLNIAKQTEILALMREASFVGLFVGIETPEADALKAMRKEQNNSLPMMDAIKTLNDYGLEVTSGIILGLDTDTDDTEARLEGFHRALQHPDADHQPAAGAAEDAAVGPAEEGRTPQRRSAAGKQRVFLRPYDEVVAMWRRAIAYANDPERLFERFRHQVDATYVNRLKPPARGKLTRANLRGAAVLALQRAGDRLQVRLPAAVLARRAPRACGAARSMRCSAWASWRYHLIQFTREALRGDQNASFYSTKE